MADGETKAEDEKKDLAKVGYFQLYRYASKTDRIIMILALLSATCVGLAQPGLMIVFGDMTGKFWV